MVSFHDESLVLLRGLLAKQSLAVLATRNGEQPYSSLVAFWAADDLRSLVFVTSRATTKYRNLLTEPRVSVLIDNRAHAAEDFARGAAVTAIGRTVTLAEEERARLLGPFVEKHPYLDAFARSPSTAMCRVAIATYYLVTRFQHVVEMDVRQWPFLNP